MEMINKYDERYKIYMATYKDIEAIMEFIDMYWKKDHILAKDRMLFEYEFVEGKHVHMILAVDRKTQMIEGIFGFLYCSHSENIGMRDIWGSFWKVNDLHDNEPLLGIELAKRAYELTGCRMHIGSGANPNTTIPLRRIFFGDKTGRMKQYYLLNETIEKYKICCINNPQYLRYKEKKTLEEVIELHTMGEFKHVFDIEGENTYPYKDNWYIEKRFYNHPYYEYKIYGLREKQQSMATAVVVCREVEAEGAKILRIVDYLGKHQIFAETGEFWKQKMIRHGYEYIDFYEFGMDDKVLNDAGFVYRMDGDENIIPNYFEPFLRENVDIWVHYKYEGTTFFKADCDQDRPNHYRG